MTLQFADAQPAWSRTEIDPQRLWPTLAEERALQAAKRRAQGEEKQPKSEWGAGYYRGAWGSHDRCVDKFGGTGGAKVQDGTDNYAVVHWRRGMGFSSAICAPAHPIDIHGTELKRWDGVPRLVKQGMPQQFNHSTQAGYVTEAKEQWVTPQAVQGQRNMKRPGHIDIHTPAVRVHKVYEDHVIVKQRRFFYENAQDEHVEGAPAQAAQIHLQASTVTAHHSDQPVVHDHRPPQSLLSAILFGVRKPQQQASSPGREVDRGTLLPAPAQGQPLAISHQPGIPMPTEALKKSWSRT